MAKSLEQFMERVSIGLVVMDSDGQILSTNSFLENLLDYPKDELIGASVDKLMPEFLSFYHPLYEAASSTAPDNVATGKGRVSSARKKDGSPINVEVMLERLDDGELMATIVDVTERESALEALRESQEINRTGFWSFDLTTNNVWWSPELFRFFELPVSDLAPPYDTHKTLFTEESWQRLEPAVAAAAEHGTPYELELELAEKIKTQRFAVARCNPQTDLEGNVVRLVGTFQDITDVVTARLERDRVLDRLSLAKKAAGIGIWEWNQESNELVWDETMCHIYGFDQPPTQYEQWRDALHPDDVVKAEADLDKAISGQGIFNSNFRIMRGNEVRHILAAAAIKSNLMIGVNTDITELVRFREEARRMNNLESLGELAGGIAHDFNNQLAIIRARAELISMRGNEPDFVVESAAGLLRTIDGAANLTKQLLTFSKGGAPVKESTSIQELLRHNVEFSLRGAAVSVDYDFDSDLWNVDVDPHQIGQVIQNIVINAVQAMKHAGGKLHVKAQNFSLSHDEDFLRKGNYIRLDILDTGPGIPLEVLPKIFDPYYTTKEEGHGLGLAICHSIISQHDGSINVSSDSEAGTCFTICLPSTHAPVSDKKPISAVSKGEGRVLVVDDMPDVRESIGYMVEVLGYDCELAGSVEEAKSHFKYAEVNRTPFNVVITDLTMPGSGGGLDVLHELKAIDPSIKIIVASGYANNSVVGNANDMGFDGSLNKPFTLSELGTALSDAAKSN